ncbi:MAG: hypothetical protein EXS37_06965, partial [Opitutus sp.]|nr:hypothetical protein [Opitutus sp.]
MKKPKSNPAKVNAASQKSGSIVLSREQFAEGLSRSNKAAEHAIEWISMLADAVPETAGPVLITLARRYCGAVAEWSSKNPESAKRIARRKPDWPLVYGRHVAIREDTASALDALELGEDHPVAAAIMPRVIAVDARTGERTMRKGIDLRKPANRQAAMIFDAIIESRQNYERDIGECQRRGHRMPEWRTKANSLPPFSTKVSGKIWQDAFDIGWDGCRKTELLPTMLGSDDKPLGYYRRFHKATAREQTNIDDGARERVKDAFLNMVG